MLTYSPQFVIVPHTHTDFTLTGTITPVCINKFSPFINLNTNVSGLVWQKPSAVLAFKLGDRVSQLQSWFVENGFGSGMDRLWT